MAWFSLQAADGRFSELGSCKASSLQGSEVGELTAEPESGSARTSASCCHPLSFFLS